MKNERMSGSNAATFNTIMLSNEDIFRCILEEIFDIRIDNIKYLNIDPCILELDNDARRIDIYVESIESYISVEVVRRHRNEENKGYDSFFIHCEIDKCGDVWDSYKRISLIELVFKNTNKHFVEDYIFTDENGKNLTKNFVHKKIYIDNLLNNFTDKKTISKNKYLIMLGLNVEELKAFNRKYGDRIIEKYINSLLRIIKIENSKIQFKELENKISNIKDY